MSPSFQSRLTTDGAEHGRRKIRDVRGRKSNVHIAGCVLHGFFVTHRILWLDERLFYKTSVLHLPVITNYPNKGY
jgi:hypothetical protein